MNHRYAVTHAHVRHDSFIRNGKWCDVMWCDVMRCDVQWCDVMWCDVMPWQFPLKMQHPRSPPNGETRLLGISRYYSRHQGRSQRMRKKIRGFMYPGVYWSGVINSRSLGHKMFFHPHLDLPWWPFWICTEKFKILDLVDFGGVRFQWKPSHLLWQYPLKSLHPRKPPNRKNQIPRYKVKWNRNLHLNLYCKILRNLSLSIWWISGRSKFQGKLSYDTAACLPRAFLAWYTDTPLVHSAIYHYAFWIRI